MKIILLKFYTLPIDTFTLIADREDNIFIAKVIRFEDTRISQDSNLLNAINNEASAENRNEILRSYDYLLNNKYEVIVNEKTLDRVKNYFRWCLIETLKILSFNTQETKIK